MMVISTKTWHYQLWKFSYFFALNEKKNFQLPSTASLCQYVSRILFGTPVTALLTALWAVLIVMGFVIIPNIFSIGLGIGRYLPWRSMDEEKPQVFFLFPPIRLRQFNLPIWLVVIAFWLVVIAWAGYRWLPINIKTAIIVIGLYFLSFLALAIGLYVGYRTIKSLRTGHLSQGSWSVIKAYYKARKERFCPIITFTND